MSNASSPPLDCDVVVVGAGPIGLTSALLLQHLGHRVQILERHAEHFKQPRAVGIFHQGIRAYNALGLLQELLDTKAFQDIRSHVADTSEMLNADGEVLGLAHFNAADSKSGTAMSFAMHQPSYETVLEKTCLDRGIIVRRAVEVTGVCDKGDYMEVNISKVSKGHGNDEPAGTVRAKFVAGCDGANSIVRESSGIAFHPYQGANSRWLVVDVIPKSPGAGYQWADSTSARQYLDYKRPRTSVPSPPTRRRWEFLVKPGETSEEVMDDKFIWQLLNEFSCTPGTAEIERRTVYTLKGGWVESFAKGRVGLAGDAAHLAPQFLGQGLNSGLRDAKALCWRLDFAIRHPDMDWPRLLRDYSNEQVGTTKVFVAAAIALEKFYTIIDEEEAKKRDEIFKKGVPPPPDLERLGSPGMYIRHENTEYPPRDGPGSLFMHNRVEIDRKDGFLDNVIGTGWILLGKGPEDPLSALNSDTAHAYKDLYGGLSTHFGDGGCRDVSGKYTEWFASAGVKAVLLRPDFYIFGMASKKEEIEEMVKAAVEHVSGTGNRN